jgi:hypothetical protein
MFYGLYYALLSRETFFKLNRIYLIISLLCGLVIPFSIPTMAVTTTSPMVEIVQPIVISMVEIRDNIETNFTTPEAATWSLWTVLKGVYILGMMLLFVKFFIGLNKIFHLYKTGEKEIRDIFKLIKTSKTQSPFSFFNLIFINQKTTEDVDYQQIIEHEKAHVIQKHSFDIVGLEILRGLFWLSPLVHLYARSLRNVHEYLADAAVLQNTEKQQYGRLLISQTTAGSGLVIANHLNFSQLKKRIIMMTRNESQRLMLLKYTLALPLFALLVFAFTLPNNPLMRNTEGVAEKVGNVVQSVDNQLFKKNNNRPKVTVKGTEEGWILKQDLEKVTSLEINEGFEIIKFTMVLGVGFEPEPNEAYVNQGATFNKTILKRIKKGNDKYGFRFIDIWIKDLKTNEKYIYGDSYLNVTDKMPYAHIKAIRSFSQIKEEEKAFPIKSDTLSNKKKENNEPSPLLNTGFSGGTITYEDLNNSTHIIFKEKDSDKKLICKNVEFNVLREPADGSKKETIRNIGVEFNENVKSLLKKAQLNDSYLFEYINVESSEGSQKYDFPANLFFIYALTKKPKEGEPNLPMPVIGKYKSGEISLDEFKKMLELSLQTSENQMVGEITSFRILRIPIQGDTAFEVFNRGAKFNQNTLDFIKKVEIGDKYMFINIVFKKADNSESVTLQSLSLIIK